MGFSLTDEQVMFRNMTREFAQRYVVPSAKEDDQKERFPSEILKEMAPLGLLGVTVPQEQGGLGLDHIAYAIVIEELARASLSISMSLATHSVVTEMVLRWGSEEQKQKYLPAMCRGEVFSCYALNEATAGMDASGMTSKAELGQAEWVLNAEKTFVINGGVSGLILAFAKASKSQNETGTGVFLVTPDVAGCSSQAMTNKNGLRACNIANVSFRNCRIPQGNILRGVEDGNKIADSLLQGIHFGVAASCVGVSQACIDATVKYAEERRAFGKMISNFDMIQEMIADMTMGTEAARLLTYQVGELKNNGQPFGKHLAMARYLASEVAIRSATDAIVIHGAYGFGTDFPLERYFRDITEVTEYGGPPLVHKLAVARHTFGLPIAG